MESFFVHHRNHSSVDCTGEYEPIHDKSMECLNCSEIRGHAIVEGLFWRLNNSTQECTNYAWYNLRDFLELIERKNKQINGLKSEGLNRARAIAHRTTALDGHRRLLISIATSNHHCINIIVLNGLQNNASIQTMISKIALAAQGTYQPKSYTQVEYQLTYLLWKFGGPRVANLYARACGGPHTNTVAHHCKVPPLVALHVAPTESQMLQNLNILYPNSPNQLYSSSIQGYSIVIDEIALEKRLRWDPQTNMIVGVCREHSDECSLNFQTTAEANYLRDKLIDDVVHLACEVCISLIYCLILNGYHIGNRYHGMRVHKRP